MAWFCIEPREQRHRGGISVVAEALFRKLLGGRQRPAGSIDFDHGLVGGWASIAVRAGALACSPPRQRRLVGASGLDTAPAQGANRFRRAGDTGGRDRVR